jgi:hypothetical protein
LPSIARQAPRAAIRTSQALEDRVSPQASRTFPPLTGLEGTVGAVSLPLSSTVSLVTNNTSFFCRLSTPYSPSLPNELTKFLGLVFKLCLQSLCDFDRLPASFERRSSFVRCREIDAHSREVSILLFYTVRTFFS